MPPAMIAAHVMGDNALWAAGGMGDQPAWLVKAVNRVRYIEYLLKQESSPHFKANETLSGHDMVELTKLQDIRRALKRP